MAPVNRSPHPYLFKGIGRHPGGDEYVTTFETEEAAQAFCLRNGLELIQPEKPPRYRIVDSDGDDNHEDTTLDACCTLFGAETALNYRIGNGHDAYLVDTLETVS